MTALALDAPADVGGAELHALVERLFPIPRSLTGPGYRETLAILEEVAGTMERHMAYALEALKSVLDDDVVHHKPAPRKGRPSQKEESHE